MIYLSSHLSKAKTVLMVWRVYSITVSWLILFLNSNFPGFHFSFFFRVKSCSCDDSGGNREDRKYFSTSNCWCYKIHQDYEKSPHRSEKLYWFCCQPELLPLYARTRPVGKLRCWYLQNWPRDHWVWHAAWPFPVSFFSRVKLVHLSMLRYEHTQYHCTNTCVHYWVNTFLCSIFINN